MRWNIDPKEVIKDVKSHNDVKTQDGVNDLLCNKLRTLDSSVPAGYKFDKKSGYLDEAIGISITGVVFYNGMAAENIDLVYPAPFGKVKDISGVRADEKQDDNLLHPQTQGRFHYHTLSPAFAKTEKERAQPAVSFTGDTNELIEGYFKSSSYSQGRKVVGLAKDGHIIWGPYKKSGSSYKLIDPCDVDVCNGMEVDGQYGYASTLFHPYLVGCWGPGSSPIRLGQQCSAKPRFCIPPPPPAPAP